MRRSAWLRALAGIWAIWLQGALLDPGAFDHCPEHAQHAAMLVAAHAGHSAHEHGAPADHHASHSCTCLGACCCAPLIAVLPPRIGAPVVASIDAAPVRHDDVGAIVGLRPHSLPFANGPPASPASVA